MVIGKPERATQNRVIKLFHEELGYRYLGDWTDRDGNSNLEEKLLTTYLTKCGYSPAQISVAIHKLRTEADNHSRTLYVGMTNNLERRVYEHKQKLVPGFTSRYNITQLMYYEVTNDPRVAIEREKQIKGWLRAKKVALIVSANPNWQDLSAEWYK